MNETKTHEDGHKWLQGHLNDEQLRALMGHLQEVFWIKNAEDDAVLYVSPAYTTLSGHPRQEIYDDLASFLEIVHTEDRERVAEAMRNQRAKGGYEVEYRVVRPDGVTRWIRARSFAIRGEEGEIVRFAGVAEDISDRRALEVDRAKLAALVEYSEDAIISMSVDCVIIGWNGGAERQYGYSAEEVIGCPLSVLLPTDHYQEYLRILRKVRQGEPVSSYDTQRRRKDGALFSASVSIFPIEVRDHEIVGVSKISRDVTAIKTLEAQFVEAQKLEVVGRLAAGMAHDFNNLLFVIQGCSELLIEALAEESPLRRDVETIRQAAERAGVLTCQLMVLARKQRVSPVVLDLNSVVEDLRDMLRHLVDENIDLTMTYGDKVDSILADPGHLGQVLMNLVINARDAMPGGGRLSVTTGNVILDEAYAQTHKGATPGRYVQLSVSDTGSGMTDEVKAHIFEHFFTTKPKGKGSGLGLATCNMIVKQCHGHIEVWSEVGKGTTFKVFLPSAGEHANAFKRTFQADGPRPLGTEALLVIERDRAVRELACGVLRSLGYAVHCASNQQEGERVLREHAGPAIRLVISDDGFPKSASPNIRLLLTSECPEDTVGPPPGSSTLSKPYTPAHLAQKVRAMLDE